MTLSVVGAGLGRTGTNSLKLALEQLLGGPCHHMFEVFTKPEQKEAWTRVVRGEPVDLAEVLSDYRASVDFPSCVYWRELLADNPDALVLLSVRESPEVWYRSASRTILPGMQLSLEGGDPWLTAFAAMLGERFSRDFDDPQAMMDAYQRHNDAVRAEVPPDRLLEWQPTDGWKPICERLGLPVPAEPFPVTNTTEDFRTMAGLGPVED